MENVGGGYVQQTGEQFLVQAVGLLKDIEDIKAVPLKSLETFHYYDWRCRYCFACNRAAFWSGLGSRAKLSWARS